MNYFFQYVFFFLINCVLFSEDYNLSGYVLDIESKSPLKSVNISLENQIDVLQTDEDGYFNYSFKDLKNDYLNLNLKLIGYENKTIKINLLQNQIRCNGCNEVKIDLGYILLNIESLKLDTIEVKSNYEKTNQISDISIAGIDLNENLKGNIASTLSKLPNVGINSFGVATSKPSLRGFSGDRFLLTKDGIETGDLSQSSIDHAIAVDMSEVNQINIIRGPKALIYGPNAIGGVVNTSMSGNPNIRFEKFSTKFLYGTEFYSKNGLKSALHDGIYGSFLFYIPFYNNQLNISFNNRKYDNQSSPIGILENTNSVMDSYKVGFTHYLNNGYFNLIAENFEMDYGIPPTTSGHTTGIDIPMYKKTYQFNYQEKIDFGTLDLKFNYIDYKHYEIIPNNIFNEFELLLSKKTKNFKFEYNSENFLMGAEFKLENFKSDGINETPVTDQSNISFYGFHKQNINGKFDLLSSFRIGKFALEPKYYNYISGTANLILTDENCLENYGSEFCHIDGISVLDENGDFISLVRKRKFNNFSFSIGLNKEFKNIEIGSWLMQTMRAPRVEELYSDGPHLATYAFEIGNPDLKSEKIYGIENSIRYNSSFFNASLITFYNYSPYFFQITKNGVCEEAWNWDPFSGTSHPCNSFDVPGSNTWIDFGSAPLGWLYIYSPKGNKVIIKGYEFNLGFDYNDFEFDYDLSVVKGDDLTLNLPLSFMNPTKEVINFKFHTEFLSQRLRFTKIHSQDRLGEFETYTPGALLTDYILSLNNKNYNLTFQFNNIFNEVYYNHLSRIKSIMPEPGRNIVVVYKFFF